MKPFHMQNLFAIFFELEVNGETSFVKVNEFCE